MLPTSAETAGEALDVLGRDLNSPFSLVVTDVQMPGADGFELVARIRGNEALSQISVVMLESGGRCGDGAAARNCASPAI